MSSRIVDAIEQRKGAFNTHIQKADDAGKESIEWKVPDGCESWRVIEVLEDLDYEVEMGGNRTTGATLYIRWWPC